MRSAYACPRADDPTPVRGNQQHALLPRYLAPAPLALGDLEGVGLCTEQRSVGLPVGLCVHARNVGDVLQGRTADLDHCCGELQKDTQGCTIL